MNALSAGCESDISRLKMLDDEIEGPYLPGHLIGDQGFICVRESEIRVRRYETAAGRNQIRLRVLTSTSSPTGIRIGFEHEICAAVSEAEWEQLRSGDRLCVGIPPSAVYFVGK